MPRKSFSTKPSRVRIIAGQWRGRWIEFEDHADLRPTGDRIRETLFNWLQGKTPTSRCLDLYAGSGVLGIEAVSRGAAAATLIDNNPQVVAKLRKETEKLKADSIEVVQASAQEYLNGLTQSEGIQFDIVFIDPPFNDENQLDTLLQCVAAGILSAGALVYVEAPKGVQSTVLLEEQMPPMFGQLKSQSTGSVQYFLLEYLIN